MQAHILVLGFVQGVGFRRYVKRNATKLGLRGWVKNLSDGRVEATISGSKSSIQQLIKEIEKGSFFAEVKSINLTWEKEESFEDFSILH